VSKRLLAVLLLLSSCALAQVDSSGYSAMRWRLIGPFRAGRVTTVSGVAGDPTTFYFGTPGGGIWKTTDAGRTWRPIFDHERVASIGAIAVAPSNGRVIYAGTGEQIAGKGVYRSNDDGKTWTNVGLREIHFINGLLVDPNNPDIVLVAAAGDRRPGSNRGIYKTTDGGRNWKQVLFPDERSSAVDISFALDNPRVVYASFWRPGPGAFGQGGQDEREQNGFVFKSEDAGDTWHPIGTQGLPTEPWGRVGVAAAPGNNGKRVYCIVEQGFFRSDDGGQTWQASTKDPRVVGSFYFSRIFVDPNNADVLYVAETSMYRSMDGGHTFAAWAGAPSGDDYHVLWIDPKSNVERRGVFIGGSEGRIEEFSHESSQRMIVGVDQGAAVSSNAGQTWSTWYNQPTGQFYHVSTDNQFPYFIYAAQQDSGSIAVLSRSNNGEITYRDWFSPSAMEFSFIVPDPKNPSLIYNDGWYGSVQRVDRVSGTVTPLFVRGEGWRTSNMPPLAWSQDSKTLYMGAQKVLKTTDGGTTWQAISDDLTIRPDTTRTATRQQAQQPPRPPNGTIVELQPSRAQANEIWVGTSTGVVQVTRDGGKHWANVTPPGIPQRALVSSVEASPLDPATAYVVINESGENKPYCFRTHDLGASWQPISSSLPENEIARVIRADTVRRGLLYAGTESSVWVSFDDGDHWQPLQLNLPTTSMRDLTVHDADLVVATFGRGLWVLDDLTPLRETVSANEAAHLFRSAPAVRMRWDVYQDTPLPPETPTGENPPEGAIIDYLLKSPPSGDITLTVRDAQGAVVRQFSSARPQTSFPPANAPEYWFASLPSLTKSAGHNRFNWDLRYEHPTALQYSYYGNMTEYIEYTLADHAIVGQTPRYQPQGVMVLPGQYTVELTVDGQTYRQPLLVKPDPRPVASPVNVAAAVAAQRQVEQLMGTSAQFFKQTNALAQAAADRKARLTTAHAPEDVVKTISDLEKSISGIANGARDDLGFGPINRELSRVASALDLSDSAPGAMVRDSINKLCQALSNRQSEWRELNATAVPKANTALQSANAQSLPVTNVAPGQGCR
jgi:photosystem II stability/assembly factor-like uncharacterized protein